MKTQLLTIDPLGGAESLQFKGTGIDLREMGRADIQRVSDVEFNSELQQWQVRLLLGELAGQLLTHTQVEIALAHALMESLPFTEFGFFMDDAGNATFAEYEDGVAAEVLVIQWARLTGAFAV